MVARWKPFTLRGNLSVLIRNISDTTQNGLANGQWMVFLPRDQCNLGCLWYRTFGSYLVACPGIGIQWVYCHPGWFPSAPIDPRTILLKKNNYIYILSYILENSGHILSMLVGILCVTMRSYKMIMYRIYFVCWNLPAYSKGLPKSPKPLASVLMTWKSNRFISAQLTSQDATTVCQGCKRWWNHWFGWDDSVFGDSNPQKKDVSAKADERLRNTRVTRNPSSCLKSFVFPRDVRTRLPTRKSRGGPLKSSKSSWPEGQWGTVGISCGLHDMVTALIRGRAVV